MTHIRPCEQHKRGSHPNDFLLEMCNRLTRRCTRCGLEVGLKELAQHPTQAIIDADRDWYIKELES